MSSCGAGSADSNADGPAPSPTTTAASTTPEHEWPPPLPESVSTTGENAWRATWTPEADAEQQYLVELRSMGDFRKFSDQELVDTGYAMCSFYYDGATEQAVFDATVTAGKYDPVQVVAIGIAANKNFCLNLDPSGTDY
jgi:hypothetical protein